MKQTEKDNNKLSYLELRKKYPQKLKQSSTKAQIIITWIKQAHLSQFVKIYQNNQEKLKQNMIKKQKVLDQNENPQTDLSYHHKLLNSRILESVKIIVQAYQKNIEISQKYDYQNVEQMVVKTKLTAQQLFRQNKNETNKIVQEKQKTKSIVQKTQIEHKKQQKLSQQMPVQSVNNTKKPQTVVKQPQAFKHQLIQNKPTSNSLFVAKQAPITQQNIFKGQNNFRRPSSRLANQKTDNLMNLKPKSSTKSERSKKTNLSSRGQKQIQKDSQQKSEQLSDLQVQQKRQKTQNKNNSELNNQSQVDQNQQQEQINQQQEVQDQSQVVKPQKKKKIQFMEDNLHLPSPFKLSNQRPTKIKSPVQSILSNPFIKKTFNHICKQSYIGGGKTFQQIAQSSDGMNLNKWMVFCKQFDFISKLKKKALVDIFQQCTQMKPVMTQKQFLDALIILQSKLRIDEEDFIRKNMCLDSELAFRQKVSSFKINYTGAKHNFFEQATYKPLDRYYQHLRKQKYQKQKQKQKQFILHQGKFKQQIKSQLNQRKNIRQLKKINGSSSVMQKRQNQSRSLLQSSLSKQIYRQNSSVKSPYLRFVQNQSNNNSNNNSLLSLQKQMGLSKVNISRRIDPLKYSDIFNHKNSISTNAFISQKKSTDQNIVNQKTSLKNDKNTLIKQFDKSTQFTERKILNKSTNNQQKITKKKLLSDIKPSRQWTEPIKNWADQFDKSESQESDDILRQHLINERDKQKNLPEKLPLSRIVQKYKKDQKWLEHNFDENQEWERQTQLQTTKHQQRFK